MPLSLVLLTGLVIAVAAVAVVKPSTLFSFPVISCLLLLAFIIPQCWVIVLTGSMNDFDPDLSWTYMLSCVVMTLIGFRLGTASRFKPASGSFSDFDMRHLSTGAIVSSAIGLVAFVLMLREAATGNYGSQWTGVIALYSLLTSLITLGTTLSWIIYLRNGSKISLANALVGFAIAGGMVLFAARREVAFAIFTSIMLAMVFVRKYRVPRSLILCAGLAGTIFINEVGQIRNYMDTNKTSLMTAVTKIDLLDVNSFSAEEVSCAVNDIAIAQWNGRYAFFSGYYNTFVQLYFPAFIFGKDAKDNAKIDDDPNSNPIGVRRESFGATRTGFSSTFIGFHQLGSLVFLVIAYMMGVYWKSATSGNVKAQFYYIALLPSGLKIFTESPEHFVGSLPFIFGSMMIIFAVSRVRPSSQSRVPGTDLIRIGAKL